MKMRIGQMKDGLVEIIRKRGGAVLVRPLNKVKAQWVKAREVKALKRPERGMILRMIKDVGFDQDCGCTAVVEFLATGKVEAFNVYGDFEAYLRSKVRVGSKLSEYHRRKHLKEHGFLRGKGMVTRVKVKDERRKVRQFERGGYAVAD
jgi:hypothetical protein